MSLLINNNYGTVNHIENSKVTINNGRLTAEACEPVQLAEEIASQSTNSDKPHQHKPNAAQMCTEELFKHIHYEITDDAERLHIHKSICNIVRLPKVQQICDALEVLKKNKKILSSIDPKAMLAELRRLGMPADQKGFSDQNFYSYYRTK